MEGEMDKATINGVELEYEVGGSGEPVLLVPNGPIADCFRPFMSAPSLAGRYRLIRYHQRGQVGSTRPDVPVSFAEHAADAAALLTYLGVARAHVVGHSTGATIALQLATDHAAAVHSLVLLEPPLLAVPSAGAFLEAAGPSFASYSSGDGGAAMELFLAMVSGLQWEECRAVLERNIPGSVSQAVQDADTFFGSILPALTEWTFGSEKAATVSAPVLSVVGTETAQLFVEGNELLQSWFPQLQVATIGGVGHFLQMQKPEPVAGMIAGFVAQYAMAAGRRSEQPARPTGR
jgi:3-oxoadipate enol-lactonase